MKQLKLSSDRRSSGRGSDDRRRRPLIRTIYDNLPAWMRFAYMRSQIRITRELDSRFTFKVAQSQDELATAYKILHESYLEKGYTKPQISGMRIVKYFALPTTTTLIAMFDGTVVGTISIIRRSSFGIPMEKIYNINEVLGENKVIAEISSLAIAKEFRQSRGALFLPLLKFFWHYVLTYMRLDAIVITVNPSMSDFYEGFLGFNRLKDATVGNYDFANGNPGVGLWYDVQAAHDLMKKLYGHKSDEKNLYKFFYSDPMPHFQFPDREYYKSSDPVMTLEMMNYFFVKNSTVFDELTYLEKMDLVSCYPKGYLRPLFSKDEVTSLRNDIRHSVNISCILKNSDQKTTVIVLDSGSSGLRVFSDKPLAGIIHLRVPISNKEFAEVSGEVRWQNKSTAGIKLLRTDDAWNRFYEYMQKDYARLSAASRPAAALGATEAAMELESTKTAA